MLESKNQDPNSQDELKENNNTTRSEQAIKRFDSHDLKRLSFLPD